MSSAGVAAASRYTRIAFAGFAALAVAIGVGRFAFTPVLPLMQESYAMPVADAGWLAASNYIGYFLGSLAMPVLRLQPRTAIRAGLVAIVAVTAAMAVSGSFAAWFLLRGVAGFASAVVFVAVSTWALAALAPAARPLLNASVYAGVGIGIAAAGLLCVGIVRFALGAANAWLALGAAAAVVTAIAWRRFGAGDAAQADPARVDARLTWTAERVRLIVAYGFLGFGYIVPATFLPAMAKQSLADPQQFVWAWPIFGAAAAASTYALAYLPKSFDLRKAWLCAQIVMAIGVALPLVSNGHAAILVAAFAVGGTFMLITSAAIQEARKAAPQQANAFIAAMTASFALGQIAGPIAVSAVPAGHDAYAVSLASACLLLMIGAALLARRGGGSTISARSTRKGSQ